MVVRLKRTDQTPKTPTAEWAKIYTISTINPAEKSSASRVGVSKADLDRPRLTQPPLSLVGGASVQVLFASPSRRIIHQNQIHANSLIKISFIHSHPRQRRQGQKGDRERG